MSAGRGCSRRWGKGRSCGWSGSRGSAAQLERAGVALAAGVHGSGTYIEALIGSGAIMRKRNGVDRRAVSLEREGLGRAAVTRQCVEHRIGAVHTAGRREAARRVVGDIVAAVGSRSAAVSARGAVGDDAVGQGQAGSSVAVDAAAAGSTVAREGAVVERQTCSRGVQAAAIGSAVVGESAVDDSVVAVEITDGAAIQARGAVAREEALGDGQRRVVVEDAAAAPGAARGHVAGERAGGDAQVVGLGVEYAAAVLGGVVGERGYR